MTYTKDQIYELLTYKVQGTLSTYILDNVSDLKPLNLDVLLDDMSRNLVMTLSKAIFTKTERVDSFEHYPKTWWEHFKKDHMPKWFLAKFPVKFITTTKSITVNTPCVHIKSPERVTRVRDFGVEERELPRGSFS